MIKRIRTFKHNFDRWVYNTNIFSFLIGIAIVVDAIYIIMFLVVSQFFLAIMMAGMIAYYYSLLKKRDERGRNTLPQMICMLVLVYVQCIFSSIFIGVESGFNLLLLSMIPVCFFVEYLLMNSSIISYFVSVVALLTNIILISFGDPFVVNSTLSIMEYKVFEAYNWAVAIVITVFSATVFMAEVFNISNGLSNQNRKLHELANYDPLTQLLLRRPLLEELEKCVEQKKYYAKDYAICIGDIDFFKKFNDKYGHDCGDVVLKTVSRMIVSGVREGDFVCRWGGEEILILFPDTTVYEAEKIVERVRKDIEGTSIHYKDEDVNVTMTFGVSSSEKHIMSKEVIEAADKALYDGKESGRNKVLKN